jgi:hypothetical protein
MENFRQVELDIEKRLGSVSIAAQTYMPDINIGNVASNSFSTPEQQVFEFDVEKQDNYAIAIYSAASPWSDCIVGQLLLVNNSYVDTAIENHMLNSEPSDNRWYDLQGRPVSSPAKPGLYINKGKKHLIN